jgi:RimJ/RimL family protein N-acetyltransferase
LRPWTAADVAEFHALWGDSRVSFWAARHDDALVGSVCLQPAPWDASEIEVGWHLLPEYWGQGYATEAAAALMDEAFLRLEPARLVCSILPDNLRSPRVAARLGFTRYAENFLRAGLPHDLLEVGRRARTL